MIVEAKESYSNKLSKKLDDPSTMLKVYWSILNTFLGNKKIPNIPPLKVNGKIIFNFEKKRNYSIHTLPLNVLQLSILQSVLPPLEYKTKARLASVNVKEDYIYLV